jgi:hypothetical protein
MSQNNPVHAPIPLPEHLSYYNPPIYAWVFQVVSFPPFPRKCPELAFWTQASDILGICCVCGTCEWTHITSIKSTDSTDRLSLVNASIQPVQTKLLQAATHNICPQNLVTPLCHNPTHTWRSDVDKRHSPRKINKSWVLPTGIQRVQ